MASKSTTKTKVTPYDAAAIKAGQGALDSGYAQAQAKQAQFSPAIDSAIGQIGQNIAHPPAYQTDARTQLDNTINGQYLKPDSNPYTKGMADLIAQRTQGGYNQSFGASGRAHGGLAALLSSQGVGDALGQFYGGVYENERGRQQQAVGMAPQFNQDEYTGVNNLLPAVSNYSNMGLNTANNYAQGMGNLIAPYASTKTTQRTPFGLQQAVGLAAQIGGAIATGGTSLAASGAMSGLGGMMGGGNMSGPISNPYGSGGLSSLMQMPQINNGLGGWVPHG
jgi:hypothetical protein